METLDNTASMTDVTVDNNGVLKNLLAGNYSDEQIVFEYLNNVLSKNKHSEYEIIYYFRNLYPKSNPTRGTLFIFSENNSIGFENLEQLKSAYQIAKSDRTGTNNMGNGIYSPLTIDKTKDTMHLFIQSNSSGIYYSVAYFDSRGIKCSGENDPEEYGGVKLYTEQGTIDENNMIYGCDISSILNAFDNGTISIWCNSEDRLNDKDKYFNKSFVNTVVKHFNTKNAPYCRNSIKESVGKRYNYYIENGINIYTIEPINDGEQRDDKVNIIGNDILKQPDKSIKVNKKKYNVRITKNHNGQDIFLVKDEFGDWHEIFEDTHVGRPRKNPINEESLKCTGEHELHAQDATFTIYDYIYTIEEESQRKSNEIGRRNDRLIWVKIDDIYICSIDVSLPSPFSNARFTLEFDKDDKVDKYMALNINKANSRMNDNIFNRLNYLAKYTLRKWDTPIDVVDEKKVIPYNFEKLNPKSLIKLAIILNIEVSAELVTMSETCIRKNKEFNKLFLKIEDKLKI